MKDLFCLPHYIPDGISFMVRQAREVHVENDPLIPCLGMKNIQGPSQQLTTVNAVMTQVILHPFYLNVGVLVTWAAITEYHGQGGW